MNTIEYLQEKLNALSHCERDYMADVEGERAHLTAAISALRAQDENALLKQMCRHKYEFTLYASANSIGLLQTDLREAAELIGQKKTGLAGGNADRHCHWSLEAQAAALAGEGGK